MRILVTNDDGVHAPGLLALVRALLQSSHVDVLAPEREWSAAGHQRTIGQPLRVRATQLADGTPALSSNGTPSDCVTLALSGILETPPDLVVAGINQGGNMGHDIASSGTVAAAIEAAMRGVPGVAVSLDDWSGREFEAAAEFVSRLVGHIERNGLSPDAVLNVNVPALPRAQVRGVSVTTLGGRAYKNLVDRRIDPLGVPYYWIAAGSPSDSLEPGTDIEALKAGRVSITPLSIDRTHHVRISELTQWNLD